MIFPPPGEKTITSTRERARTIGKSGWTLAQISLNDLGVPSDFFRGSVRDSHPVIQDVDPFADAHHYHHLVRSCTRRTEISKVSRTNSINLIRLLFLGGSDSDA